MLNSTKFLQIFSTIHRRILQKILQYRVYQIHFPFIALLLKWRDIFQSRIPCPESKIPIDLFKISENQIGRILSVPWHVSRKPFNRFLMLYSLYFLHLFLIFFLPVLEVLQVPKKTLEFRFLKKAFFCCWDKHWTIFRKYF